MQRKKLIFLFEIFSSERPGFPMQNANNKYLSKIFTDLNTSGLSEVFEIEFSSIGTCCIESDVIYFFPIEIGCWKFSTLFNNLNVTTRDFIIKNNISLLFYFPDEGFSCKGTRGWNEGWLMHLKKQMALHNFHKNRKYLISGNLKIEEDYRNFFKNNKDLPLLPFSKTFPISFFEWRLNSVNSNEVEVNYLLSDIKFDFLSYNANLRYHRLAFVSEIVRKNLHANALFSCIGSTDADPKLQMPHSLELLDNEGKDFLIKFIESWSPIVLDIDRDEKNNNPYNINYNHYKKTFFSLVSETEISEESIFITEKTFKPIKGFHPFIVFGSPNILRMLRSMGYHTFPELFDESYDDEPNAKKRLEMILKEVERVNKIPYDKKIKVMRKSIVPKLVHNKKRLEKLENIGFKKQMIAIFSKIYSIEQSNK